MKNSIQYIVSILSGMVLFLGLAVCAQEQADIDKIAASQAGSSPLLFIVPDDKVLPIIPNVFLCDSECTVRLGMPNLFSKIKSEKEITIAFIGGSITQGRDGYRIQTARYMQSRFPKTTFRWINAGVSGTGTDLGVFRIREQVLQYQPDLVFIEFAVNGAYQPGMEGMIRQIIKTNPFTDICLIYTIKNGQTEIYQRGEIPRNIQGLELMAEHYRLPSIHLGIEVASLEAQGKLVWKGIPEETKDRILFSRDGIHPLKDGGNLYTAAIARAIEKMDTLDVSEAHELPAPLITDVYDDAGMYDPLEVVVFDENWTPLITKDSSLKQFQGWFDMIMTSNKPEASFTFFFEGDQFGIFDIGGPEVGQLSIWIDDCPIGIKMISDHEYRLWEVCDLDNGTILNRFNQFCNNRYRGQYDIIQLKPGRHKVTLRISPEKANKHEILGLYSLDDLMTNFEKYNQTFIYLGRILLRGKPIKDCMK